MSAGDAFDLLRFLEDRWRREEMVARELSRPRYLDVEGVPVPEHLDPVRVASDVAAKRAMVSLLLESAATIDGEWGCGHEVDELREHCTDLATMRFLMDALTPWVQIYKDLPGFRQEWERTADGD